MLLIKSIFISQEPPPVNGQSVANVGFRKLFESNGIQVSHLSTSSKTNVVRRKKISYRLISLFHNCLEIIRSGTAADFFYISLAANLGKIESLIYVCLISIIKKDVLVHHHTYSHIKYKSFPLICINSIIRNRGYHIFNCEGMKREYCDKYDFPMEKCFSFPNMLIMGGLPTFKRLNKKVDNVVLGHMSNLSFDKGLSVVVDSFIEAKNTGLADKLILAGPFGSENEEKYIKDVLSKESSIDYIGPVYGEDKSKFFRDLTIFLFPSVYKNETQGIVNIESICNSVPVIAYNQCCIAETIGSAGSCINRNEDFSAHLQDILYKIKNEDLYGIFLENCNVQYNNLLSKSNLEKNIFFDFIKKKYS